MKEKGLAVRFITSQAVLFDPVSNLTLGQAQLSCGSDLDPSISSKRSFYLLFSIVSSNSPEYVLSAIDLKPSGFSLGLGCGFLGKVNVEGRSRVVRWPVSARITILSTIFCISRMFPGHGYSMIQSSKSKVIFKSFSFLMLLLRRKWLNKSGMSSVRSRRGGSTIGTTLRR